MNYHGRMMNIQLIPPSERKSHDYLQGHRDARHAAAGIANEVDKQITGLQSALAFWIAVAFTNGAAVPDDLVEWSQIMLAGERRVAVEVTREALGLEEE